VTLACSYVDAHDYAEEHGQAFHWNEWERMNLDASRTEDLSREVKEFWDLHFILPIPDRGRAS
jgi:hypothetical protein